MTGELSEERVREIVREEISAHFQRALDRMNEKRAERKTDEKVIGGESGENQPTAKTISTSDAKTGETIKLRYDSTTNGYEINGQLAMIFPLDDDKEDLVAFKVNVPGLGAVGKIHHIRRPEVLRLK